MKVMCNLGPMVDRCLEKGVLVGRGSGARDNLLKERICVLTRDVERSRMNRLLEEKHERSGNEYAPDYVQRIGVVGAG